MRGRGSRPTTQALPDSVRYGGVASERAPIRATHVIHDLRRGGAEHVLVDLAGVARDAGIDLSVVSLLPTRGMAYADDLAALGVDVVGLGLRGWWDPRAGTRMRAALADLRPDVVHTHLKHADVIGGRAAARLQIPHVSTLHVIEDRVGRVEAWKRDLALRSRRATTALTIAVSEAQRRWYLDLSGADPATVVTIHNGVPDPGPADAGVRAAVRSGLDVPEHAVMGVMVAVMRPGKGHDTLIRAMPSVANRSVVIVLVGDGVERARLEEHAGDDPRLRFAGFREDVADVLGAADFVVHPSDADALPTALVHALAASRPVIASRVGGIPEIVTEDSGVLIEAGDAAGLAAAIDRLADAADTRRWMGKRGRERYDAGFRAERWAVRLADAYRSILDREAGAIVG